MKKMRSSEKVTQKMTRSGAVSENLATGEVTHISRREAEENFSAPKETAGLDTTLEQASLTHTRHRERKAFKEAAKVVQEGSRVWNSPSSRLQFSEEERTDPGLKKYIRRSERAADKLDAAKAAIPTRKVPIKQHGFDETTGRFKTAIRFESVEKVPNGKLRHTPLSRPLEEIGLTVHGEVHKAEQENVGVEAGHKAEELGEHSVLYAESKVREAALHHRTKPWQDAAKAEKEAIRANGEYLYRKAVRDDPSLSSSNPVSRYLHKRRIQKEAARQFRQAQNTAHSTRGIATRAKEATQAAVSFVRNHSNLLLPVLGVGLILVMLIGGVSSCSMMAGSGVSSVLSTSYLSEDADILAAEAAYCAMEAELQEYLDTYRSTHSYDEYHFNLDTIEHDPYVLISILSALHEGVFTIEEVRGDLEMLFGKQYILTETVETETRYRTEIKTEERPKRDPITGEILYDKFGNPILEEYEYEEVVPYTYSICTVELENFNLSHVPVYILSEEALSMYAAYMGTLGAEDFTSLPPAMIQKYTEHFKQPELFASLGGQIVSIPVEPENPLRTAEMTLEDDYGMIDGIINNGRRDEELEKAQAKARRTTPEKKPSIRERLEEAKRESAERKSPDKPAPQKKPPEHDL